MMMATTAATETPTMIHVSCEEGVAALDVDRSTEKKTHAPTQTDRQADAHLPPVAGELLVELFCFLAKFFGIPGHYSGLLNGKFRLFAQHRHIVDRVG